MIQIPYTILLPIFLAGMFIVFTVQAMGKSLTSTSTRDIPLTNEEMEQMLDFERYSSTNVVVMCSRSVSFYSMLLKNEFMDDGKYIIARTIPELKAKAQNWCREIAEQEKARMEAETL